MRRPPRAPRTLMRVVADTNVIVSGLLWRGNPQVMEWVCSPRFSVCRPTR
jgi:predicted nucleic acid-binding protein